MYFYTICLPYFCVKEVIFGFLKKLPYNSLSSGSSFSVCAILQLLMILGSQKSTQTVLTWVGKIKSLLFSREKVKDSMLYFIGKGKSDVSGTKIEYVFYLVLVGVSCFFCPALTWLWDLACVRNVMLFLG